MKFFQKIAVSCENLSAIVNLPRVLRALDWLKANNNLYADVTINQAFQFTANDVIFDKPPTDDQLKALINLDKEPHLLDPIDPQLQMVSNVAANQPSTTGYQQYALNKLPYNPTKWDHENVDAKCFPYLFPNGMYAFHDSSRLTRLPHRPQMRARLLNSNRRFAQSPEYLALCNGIVVQKDIQSVMGVQARMKKTKLNADGNDLN